jgi:DegV family protein with EDD domain
MSKITLSADFTADLSDALYKKNEIVTTHMGITIGDNIYSDKDLTPADIYKAVEISKIVPKTSAVHEDDYRRLFEKATENGGSIIHIGISDKLSASFGNARRAAQGLERVYLIDSKQLSGGTGFIALKAREYINTGKSVQEVVAMLEDLVKTIDLTFILSDLWYLYKGGRASGLKLLGANLLKIRISLIMDDKGFLVPDKKFVGNFAKAVKDYTAYRMEAAKNAKKDLALVIHTDIPKEIAKQVVEDVKAAGFEAVVELTAGTTITTHCGRNTIGIGFARG